MTQLLHFLTRTFHRGAATAVSLQAGGGAQKAESLGVTREGSLKEGPPFLWVKMTRLVSWGCCNQLLHTGHLFYHSLRGRKSKTKVWAGLCSLQSLR